MTGGKVDWIDGILGSGLGLSLIGWVYSAGKGSQRREAVENRIEDLEEKVEKHDIRLDKQDVLYAAIDAKLDLLIEMGKKGE